MEREEREAWMRRKAALAALPKHPSWPQYIAEHEREIADIEKRMLRLLQSPLAVDQRQIDFWRGCLSILRWQLTMPNIAERNLIRYLRSQGVEVEEEEMMVDV
jgi:hypothetical protein